VEGAYGPNKTTAKSVTLSNIFQVDALKVFQKSEQTEKIFSMVLCLSMNATCLPPLLVFLLSL
jgi:hypothetical protein